MDDATPARRSAWDGIAVGAEAPVVVIHARRAGEIAAESQQQVA